MKYSQFNEEEILNSLVDIDKGGFFVEIGCLPDHKFSNTKALHERGWSGIWIDRDKHEGMIQETITADNINSILQKHNVPKDLNLMSIDIDGNDYYVFEALEWKPKVLVIEYNKNMPQGVMERNDAYEWKGGWAFGSSKTSMIELAERKGYKLAAENESNLFFTCQNQ